MHNHEMRSMTDVTDSLDSLSMSEQVVERRRSRYDCHWDSMWWVPNVQSDDESNRCQSCLTWLAVSASLKYWTPSGPMRLWLRTSVSRFYMMNINQSDNTERNRVCHSIDRQCFAQVSHAVGADMIVIEIQCGECLMFNQTMNRIDVNLVSLDWPWVHHSDAARRLDRFDCTAGTVLWVSTLQSNMS
jgi:hypothetical protein